MATSARDLPPVETTEDKPLRTDLRDLTGRQFLSGSTDYVNVVNGGWVPKLTYSPSWNAVNALNLALLADLAYASGERIGRVFDRLRLGNERPTSFGGVQGATFFLERVSQRDCFGGGFFGSSASNGEQAQTHTQLYVAHNPDQLLIAARGTEPTNWTDWLTNISFQDIDFEEAPGGSNAPQVHAGFYRSFQFASRFLEKVEEREGDALFYKQDENGNPTGLKDFVLCGHSLGGAIATLLAASLRLRFMGANVMLYTYGSPRMGDTHFCDYFGEEGRGRFVHHRHVMHNDIVPHVPVPGLDLAAGRSLGDLLVPGFPPGVEPDLDGSWYAHHGALARLHHTHQEQLVTFPDGGWGHLIKRVASMITNMERGDAWRLIRQIVTGELTWERFLEQYTNYEYIADHYMQTYHRVLRHHFETERLAFQGERDAAQARARKTHKAMKKRMRRLEDVRARCEQEAERLEQRTAAAQDALREQVAARLAAEGVAEEEVPTSLVDSFAEATSGTGGPSPVKQARSFRQLADLLGEEARAQQSGLAQASQATYGTSFLALEGFELGGKEHAVAAHAGAAGGTDGGRTGSGQQA